MQREYIINDLDSAFDVIIASLKNEEENFTVLFDDIFDIRIKLQGDQWNGKIDYRAAKFVLALQKQIIKIHNEFSTDKISIETLQNKKSELSISISVEQGCTEFVAHLKDALQYLADLGRDMESSHKMLSIVAVALITGGYLTFAKVEEEATKRIEKIEEEQTKKAFAKVAIESIELAKNVPHMEYLSKQMRPDDMLTIPGKSYTKPEAFAAFHAPAKETQEVTYPTHIIDDRYLVATVSFENNYVKLIYKSKSIRATTDFLPEEQKDTLYKLYKDADIAQTMPAVDLQISAQVHEGKVMSAAIVGLGEKRTQAKTLIHVLAESIKRSKKDVQQQGSLIVEQSDKSEDIPQ